MIQGFSPKHLEMITGHERNFPKFSPIQILLPLNDL